MIQHPCFVIGCGERWVQHETLFLLPEADLEGRVYCVGRKETALRVFARTLDKYPSFAVRIWKTDAEVPLEELEIVRHARLLCSA